LLFLAPLQKIISATPGKPTIGSFLDKNLPTSVVLTLPVNQLKMVADGCRASWRVKFTATVFPLLCGETIRKFTHCNTQSSPNAGKDVQKEGTIPPYLQLQHSGVEGGNAQGVTLFQSLPKIRDHRCGSEQRLIFHTGSFAVFESSRFANTKR